MSARALWGKIFMGSSTVIYTQLRYVNTRSFVLLFSWNSNGAIS